MSLPLHHFSPSSERLLRTVFWTLWVLTVALTAYAFVVESFGLGLVFQDQHVPKLHMRAEALIASGLGSTAAFGLAGVSIFVSRRLRRLGVATLVLWFLYLAIPRF